MIPKLIHYCWFGRGEKTEDVKKCIESWKKFCPDYKIIEWNEDNYDVYKIPFTKQAYESKAWAFVSDYVRLDVVNQYGGIYMDTDVELLKNLDFLLDNEMYAGFESISNVSFGVGFGSKSNHEYLQEQMRIYEMINYKNSDGTLNQINCPIIQTKTLVKHGLIRNGMTQELDHVKIFSMEYFSPKSFETGEINCTENTVSIHHFSMSWTTSKDKHFRKAEWKLKKIFGNKLGKILSMTYSGPYKMYMKYKTNGWNGLKNYLKLIFRK